VRPVDDPSDAAKHDVSFYCDDIHGTVADLKSRGVQFTRDIEDHGYGFVTHFTVPGGITIRLWEPRYRKGRASARTQTAGRFRPSDSSAPSNSSRRRPAIAGPRVLRESSIWVKDEIDGIGA